MNKKIILRADGNATIGLGHVYRLLALADMLRDDAELTFAIAKPDDFMRRTIEQYVDDIIELPGSYAYILPSLKQPGEEMPFDLAPYLTGNETVVTDGYWFGTEYQKAVKNIGAKLVCIDDLAENYFYADAVINHAPGIYKRQYRGEPYTKYYLGLDYALLRKEFFNPIPQERNRRSLFISMGGADQYEITGKVLDTVLQSDLFSEIHIMISSLFSPKLKEYLHAVSEINPQQVFLHKNLETSDLVFLIDTCTYAIVSASTILIECYSRGLICSAGYYTNNQMNIYNGFVNQNLAYGWGDFNNFEIDRGGKIKRFAATQKSNSTDPTLNSPVNIRSLFRVKPVSPEIHIRNAAISDCRLIYEWVNDPEVRQNSINQKNIEWRDHQSWFKEKINSPTTKIFILEYKGIPIGQIRFDFVKDSWEIDYSISKNYRGKGFGKLIVRESILHFPPKTRFIAFAKPDNMASIHVFKSLTFEDAGKKTIEGLKLIKFIKQL